MLRKYVMLWATVGTAGVLAGCSNSPSSLRAPSINSNAGAAAVAEYDRNGDAVLGSTELDQSPPLKAALDRIDQDSDRQISADEIDRRIEAWQKSGVALTVVDVSVKMNGRPLKGAEVKLVPEKFLGEEIETATGRIDELGMAKIIISPEPETAGVRVGLYRVLISKIDAGKETVPARYNEQTELGVEIAPDVPASRNLVFNLSR